MAKENHPQQNRAHVVKRGSGWAVKKEGALRATKIYKTQAEAILGAQPLRKSGTDVVIHKEDGSVQKWEKSNSH